MKKRNRFVMILLSLITCGIYFLYWFVTTTNAIEANLKESNGHCKSGGMSILLSIVTCGIYGLYWWYTQGGRMAQLGKERGVRIEERGVLYLILMFVCIGCIINLILLQGDINRIVDAGPAAAEPTETPTEA